MSEKPEPVKCTVREGRFVDPCSSLSSVIDGYGMGRAKGVFKSDLTNTKTWEPSRSYVGIKSKQHPNGFLFNFCPFCGTQIDAPFQEKTE